MVDEPARKTKNFVRSSEDEDPQHQLLPKRFRFLENSRRIIRSNNRNILKKSINFRISREQSVLTYEQQMMEDNQYQQLLDNEIATKQALYNLESSDFSIVSGKSPTKTGKTLTLPTESPKANSGDDDNGDEDDDGALFAISSLESSSPTTNEQSITIDYDPSTDDVGIRVPQQQHQQQPTSNGDTLITADLTESQNNTLPCVEPVNQPPESWYTSPLLKDGWLEQLASKWSQKHQITNQQLHEQSKLVEEKHAARMAAEPDIRERLREFQNTDNNSIIRTESTNPIEEEMSEWFTFSADQEACIQAAIDGPADKVLISKFNLNITPRDIETLTGHQYPNDQVINFYMEMLTERSETKHESYGLPRVYAMNTFFVQRLLSDGFDGVKSWTSKVDIFAKDVIPVPVSVGGLHWCMALIHLQNRTIQYYDSMGSTNLKILTALEQYLKDESMDKLKQPFDTTGFVLESLGNTTQQLHASDCGIFSCMFAEFITRNEPVTFWQEHMEYYRDKMILEIAQGELLQ